MPPHANKSGSSAVAQLRQWMLMLLGFALITSSTPASAHFLLNLNVRIFHVEHSADGTTIYLRLPLPYLLADKVGATETSGVLPAPAPFSRNALEEGRLVHFVDFEQFYADPQGLGTIAESALQLKVGDQRLNGQVTDVRLYAVGSEPDFATLHEAQVAFSPDEQQLREGYVQTVSQTSNPQQYVGDTVIDIRLRYPGIARGEAYRVASFLNPNLPDQEKTANLILDYRDGKTQVFRSSGLLNEPIEISHSTSSAMATFIHEGVVHILAGLDHVLFVLCLIIGAASLSALMWRVTGFTVGHSVTLSAGFFGLVPSGAWFVPLVETGIALSIIYAAWMAISTRRKRSTSAPDSLQRSERWIIVGTCGLGLLHGLGFSFVLHEILKVDAPNIWQSLLAFNIGVELGQALIILAIWPLLLLIRNRRESLEHTLCTGIALSCSAIALFWTLDRSYQFVTALTT
ncbi:HupE/UreJ family protein [Microbulbifer agarilyticus]|uniref:HupE/UreJ family protein n=1 Tax=Microbulbifer agarilyticus TaxID=260552 RepID=UPI001CD30312|nr:HupE/UreJ family protein [Microbulbifer agarilyticus]MCA0892308.1 HupE/UreJ family protein [Microbulbifer agarilyticus]